MFIFDGDWTQWKFVDWAIVAIAVILIIILVSMLLKNPKNEPESMKQTESKSVTSLNEQNRKITPVEEEVKEEKKEVVLKEEKKEVVTKAEPKKVDTVMAKKESTAKPVIEETESNSMSSSNELKEKSKNLRTKYHVSQNKDEEAEYAGYWRVRKEGSTKTIKFFKTQKEAIDYAETLAVNQNATVVIHKRDGTIRKQDYSKK